MFWIHKVYFCVFVQNITVQSLCDSLDKFDAFCEIVGVNTTRLIEDKHYRVSLILTASTVEIQIRLVTARVRDANILESPKIANKVVRERSILIGIIWALYNVLHLVCQQLCQKVCTKESVKIPEQPLQNKNQDQ